MQVDRGCHHHFTAGRLAIHVCYPTPSSRNVVHDKLSPLLWNERSRSTEGVTMKTGTKTNSASGYTRRSAVDERREDTSIKYQVRYCEELAARHGLQITEWFNEGDGNPASVFTENERPAYDRALAGLGHTYSTLVAYAGTVDAVIKIDGESLIWNLKTGSGGGRRGADAAEQRHRGAGPRLATRVRGATGPPRGRGTRGAPPVHRGDDPARRRAPGVGGLMGHGHKHRPGDDPGYHGRLTVVHEVAAVTGVRALVSRGPCGTV